jgi:hypothetical protein
MAQEIREWRERRDAEQKVLQRRAEDHFKAARLERQPVEPQSSTLEPSTRA